MKVRTNYVSNSSSSSFIVKKDLSNIGVDCMKLTEEQLDLLAGYKKWEDDDEVFNPEKNQEYYLTQYISDCSDNWEKVKEMDGTFEYSNGGHGGPYDEEMFNEYQNSFDSIWLRKEHDVAKEMSFGEFIKEFLELYGNEDVIVKYEGNSIILTRVR